MSDITRSVRGYLLADSDIYAAIGTRMFPDVLPQKDGKVTSDMPSCTIEIVSGGRESDLSGGIGLARSRVSITVYAATRSVTRSLGELIQRQMLRLRGAIGTDHVRCVTCESDQDLTDPPQDGSNNWRYLRAMDFEVTHGVAVASVA